MASYNKVILMGNLTRDPEKRYTESGTCIVTMGVAVNRRVKRQNEWTEEANFFDIVVFGNQAENCAKYLAKGRPVLVDGELQQRRWEGQDGQKRSKVEVVANQVTFLGSGGGGGGGGSYGGVGGSDEPPPLDDDDIPF
ncbi:MAG: single-stranded DNA-binding protein [Deltaproteobacteria bacterium]|nr:single-stranded DNA-binding protein [Deltaproteobacteria bacterium]MCB9489295.1 single-stranded DNA-binding protein [Deltaproteobacteria bacterium]